MKLPMTSSHSDVPAAKHVNNMRLQNLVMQLRKVKQTILKQGMRADE